MSASQPDPRSDAEALDVRTDAELAREHREYVERAREYHAEHGVWPPDPLLDEVDDMRRAIMAEHGNDWRKVLQWHMEQDRQRKTKEGGSANSPAEDPPVPVESL